MTARISMKKYLELVEENKRLRKGLERISFITGGIDTPATSNGAHYVAVETLNYKEHQ